MLKHKISIERQINDRLYQFMVPYEAPMSEALAILDDVRLQLSKLMEEIQKSQSEQKIEQEQKAS